MDRHTDKGYILRNVKELMLAHDKFWKGNTILPFLCSLYFSTLDSLGSLGTVQYSCFRNSYQLFPQPGKPFPQQVARITPSLPSGLRSDASCLETSSPACLLVTRYSCSAPTSASRTSFSCRARNTNGILLQCVFVFCPPPPSLSHYIQEIKIQDTQ